jgi:hypothetical protein
VSLLSWLVTGLDAMQNKPPAAVSRDFWGEGMSADKLKAVHEALAAVFNESNLNATGTETSHAAFDHETLSEAFSEPQLNAANTEQSFARFDHAALTGIFRESFPTSPTEGPSPTSFDQAFAEILSERSPISTNVKPSQPSFDHQALAEMLSQLRADPINPQMSPLSFATESSSAPFSGQIDHEKPVAKAFAGAPPTNAESARPPLAKSLLAKLHHIFSTKEEPTLSNVEKDPLSAVSDVAVTSPTGAASASPVQATSLPNEISSPISPPTFESKSSSPPVADRLGNEDPDVKAVALAASAEAENARPRQARSLLVEPVFPSSNNMEPLPPIFGTEYSGRLDLKNVERAETPDVEWAQLPLSELPPLISPSTTPPLVLKSEPPLPVLFGQPDNLASAEEFVPATAPTDTENARLQLARSSLISTDTESRPLNTQTEPLPPTLSGQLKNIASAASAVAPTPPTNVESARPQRVQRLLAELTPTISPNPKPSLATSEKEPSRPTSSTQLKNPEPAAKTASVPLTNSESASAQPPDANLLLSGILSPNSTSTKPQPIIIEKASSPTIESNQPKHAEPAAEFVAAATLPAAEAVRPQQGSSLLAPPARSFFERKPSPAIFSGELVKVGPAVKTVAATPPAHAVMAQQSKSLPLTDLPALVSTNTKSSSPNFEQDLPSPSLSGQPYSVAPPVNSVVAAHPTGAEGALPQHASSLLAALRVLNANPSPPRLETGPSRSTLAGQADDPGMSVETIAHPTEAEIASCQTKSLLTDMSNPVSTNAKSSAPIVKKEPSRGPVSCQPADVAPTAKAVAVAPPADAESAVPRAQQAKSLLAELDLNTAIHLRWVMRDIRSKRTKFSPVSANDLKVLIELGLIEMREEQPRLTGLGVLALD